MFLARMEDGETRLRWLRAEHYPDAGAVRDFLSGDLSEARACLRAADAVLRAHDVAEEDGGLGAETLAAARVGARWLVGDVAAMLRASSLGDAVTLETGAVDEVERARVALALAQVVGFAGTGDELLRRFLVGLGEERDGRWHPVEP